METVELHQITCYVWREKINTLEETTYCTRSCIMCDWRKIMISSLVEITAEGDFHKDIYIVDRTNKAEIRPEEQSEKTESCREN